MSEWRPQSYSGDYCQSSILMMGEFALDSSSSIGEDADNSSSSIVDDDSNDDEHYEQQKDEETSSDQQAREIVIQNGKWLESTRPESPL
jgi:hypothetical protein